MIYFTSDMHFFHERIIRHCGRPFRDALEMNEKIIQNWNNTVSPDDEVFLLGDVTMKGPEQAFAVLSRLTGKKYLVSNQKFVLFHYPIAEWTDFYKGAIHLHGHQHNPMVYNHQQKQAGVKRYDVGVDANIYKPVCIEDVIKFFG